LLFSFGNSDFRLLSAFHILSLGYRIGSVSDVTHILTEEGIANLLLCRTDEEREQAIRGVAGYTAVGLARDRRRVENLRDRGVVRRPADLGIDVRDATRNLLAARSMRDLVRASGGLYRPPKKFRNW